MSYAAVPVSAVAGGVILARTGGDMNLVIAFSVAVLSVSTAVGWRLPLRRP